MILDKFSLEGKVAIVTGARIGLGQSMAIALAEAGADVVGVGRKEMAETEKAVSDLGKKFLFIEADFLTTDPIKNIIDETLKTFGRIDILVNNAGITRRSKPIDFTEKDWDDVMNINLKSVFFMSQAVAKIFFAQGNGGKIINVASVLSFQGGTNSISYTASKFGIVGITKTMSNSWSQHGINCNAIAPGYMKTDMTSALHSDPDMNAHFLSKIPAGRWGSSDDLQGAVVFLASEASKYVTGETICVDGGWMAN